jgi:hypothetical protein
MNKIHKQKYNYIDLVSKGVTVKMPGHAIFKMFSPNCFSGNFSQRDLENFDNFTWKEQFLFKKFFKKYPEIK